MSRTDTDGEASGTRLPRWLERLERLDPGRIEPGLARIGSVLRAMRLTVPPYRVFAVGGTNGKGSVAAYLSAILGSAGCGPVGTYTSPHVLDYRERIVVDGIAVAPDRLVEALDAVEASRGDTALTYFEFGTAAALEVFRRAAVREAVLEVGLGGRLDAVNAVESAAAAVVSVGLDHQKWLGEDRDSIGYEKAGIFRAGRPAVIGDRNPPAGLLDAMQTAGARPVRIGRDFDVAIHGNHWMYRGPSISRGPMPGPGISGPRQYDNAAVAIALLESVSPERVPGTDALGAALSRVRLPGRVDRRVGGELEWVLDVGHNPQAAAVLGDWLRASPSRRTLAVFGMLADKDPAAVSEAVAPWVDRWFLGGIAGGRGQTAQTLASRTSERILDPVLCENIGEAVEAAVRASQPGDRILVFGSFHTVAEALRTGRIPQEAACASA